MDLQYKKMDKYKLDYDLLLYSVLLYHMNLDMGRDTSD